MFTKPIRDVLIADATLVSLVGAYDPPGAGAAEPKVFSTDPIPEGAEFPFIVISGPVSDEPFDQKGSIGGRQVLVDIRCYTDRTGSAAAIRTLAERVRTVLHRQTVAVAGLTWIDTRIGGPIVADEEEAYGRVLSVRLLYAA